MLGLAGCATQALHSAPDRPDAPWRPNVSAAGEIIPGPCCARGLALPPGYSLPSNRNIQGRPAPPELQGAHPYSLAELIDIAQSTNPDTRRAWNTARDAALAVGIARSTYLPHLTATVVGGYNHAHDSGANAAIGNVDIGGTSTRVGNGEVQTLGLEWLLFDFGKREATIDAARQSQLATNILFTGAHQKLIYAVTLAFYTHAAATARVTLLHQALDNARKVEDAADMRLRRGQGTVVDATQARQATAQAELRLVQAEGGAENTYLDLMTAIGIPPGTHVLTQDISDRPLSLADARLTDDMIQRDAARRPDVLAAYATARASRSAVAAARAEFLPKIFVSGNVAYATGRLALSSVPGIGANAAPTLNLSSNNFSSLILGGITVPIFDGGMRAAALKQARNRFDSAETNLRQTLDEAVKQLVVAENGVHTSLSAYAASGRLQTAAQTSFDATLSAYRNGVGSITQATLAQSGLIDARLERSDAYYAALIAASSLAFAAGALGDASPTEQP
ncbi:TolC family protein [Gluconacetobacter diazotrophicus]|uniref:Protein CyaE n=2 Tax=Gluconacetobacter diazotrophicus TaxID=33996 RepID=A9HJV7_GLUDA|nr:TolC family protein [Gluconacetobacter diazotrophicus]MBB2156270.1 TolC family protein [Gluconacetobacter diazotrophicus]CAP55959.1 putative outer membrane protein [Gluconacetobacter diazotrophicus PA1 5]